MSKYASMLLIREKDINLIPAKYRVAAINPEQLQSFAGALKVVFLY
jgi:hypothetical protein